MLAGTTKRKKQNRKKMKSKNIYSTRPTGLWFGIGSPEQKHIASWSNGSTPESRAQIIKALNEHAALVAVAKLVPELIDALAFSGRDEDGELPEWESKLNAQARKALANLAAVRNQ
jgi:hypothetical protein